MPDRLVRGLRSVVLAVAVTAAIIVTRGILDQVVGPRGWNVVLVVGVFATARVAGLRAAIAVTLLVAASRFVLPVATVPGATVDPTTVVDVGIDLIAGAAAVAMSIAVERTGLRLQASDRTAEARADELERVARRDAEVRGLAQESASPQSVRQLADRFARHARSMVGADGVAVLAGPASGARPAGGPSDAPLGLDGDAPDETDIVALVADAARTGRPVSVPGEPVLVPLLAGTGALAVAAIALPDGRRLDDEELEGLL